MEGAQESEAEAGSQVAGRVGRAEGGARQSSRPTAFDPESTHRLAHRGLNFCELPGAAGELPTGKCMGKGHSPRSCLSPCLLPPLWGLRASWPLVSSVLSEKGHTLFWAIPLPPMASGPTAPSQPPARHGHQGWAEPRGCFPAPPALHCGPVWAQSGLRGGLGSVAEGRSGQGCGFELWRFGGNSQPFLKEPASACPLSRSQSLITDL